MGNLWWLSYRLAMPHAFGLLVVVLCLGALLWGVRKAAVLLSEVVDQPALRQIRRICWIGFWVLTILAVAVVGLAIFSAIVFGMGCQPVLDPMDCPMQE